MGILEGRAKWIDPRQKVLGNLTLKYDNSFCLDRNLFLLLFLSIDLSCAAVLVNLLPHERKKQRHLDSVHKCDHVQCGGPPHLPWIQAPQARRLVLHPDTNRRILKLPGSLVVTAVLRQTPRVPGEHSRTLQDSERL